MIYPVFAIRDSKVGFGAELIVQTNEPAAVRGFGFMVNNPSGMLHYSPKDFDLFHVADFDTESGQMDPVTPAKFIVNGVSVISEE